MAAVSQEEVSHATLRPLGERSLKGGAAAGPSRARSGEGVLKPCIATIAASGFTGRSPCGACRPPQGFANRVA